MRFLNPRYSMIFPYRSACFSQTSDEPRFCQQSAEISQIPHHTKTQKCTYTKRCTHPSTVVRRRPHCRSVHCPYTQRYYDDDNNNNVVYEGHTSAPYYCSANSTYININYKYTQLYCEYSCRVRCTDDRL